MGTNIYVLPTFFMNKDKVKQVIEEFRNGERTLYQTGSFHLEQGFTIFPKRNEDIEIDRPEISTIYNEITIEEARELVKSNYCTNKEAANAFIDAV